MPLRVGYQHTNTQTRSLQATGIFIRLLELYKKGSR